MNQTCGVKRVSGSMMPVSKRQCLDRLSPEHRETFTKADTISSHITTVASEFKNGRKAMAMEHAIKTMNTITTARHDVKAKSDEHAILMQGKRQRLNSIFDTETFRMSKITDLQDILRSVDIQMNTLAQMRLAARATSMQLHAEEAFNLDVWIRLKQLKTELGSCV